MRNTCSFVYAEFDILYTSASAATTAAAALIIARDKAATESANPLGTHRAREGAQPFLLALRLLVSTIPRTVMDFRRARLH